MAAADRRTALALIVSGLAAALPAGRAQAALSGEAAGGLLQWRGELTQGGWLRGHLPAGATGARLGEEPLALAPGGSFFAGFDRDAPQSAQLTASVPGRGLIAETLPVAPRAWAIQRVDAPLRGGATSAAFWQRRKPELEAIAAARALATGAGGWRQDFVWPVRGRISGLFGRQRISRGEPGSYHTGIDIAPGAGVPFAAPADGVVVLARSGFSLEGSLIIIDHGAGLNSAFLHASRMLVAEGEAVEQGQAIGHVGATGRATGPHLHWGLMWNDARLDPLLFTGPMD